MQNSVFYNMIVAATTAVAMVATALTAAAEVVFPNADSPVSFRARHGTEVSTSDDGLTIVRSVGTYCWPGVEIRPDEAGGTWDWSNVGEIRVTVSNGSDRLEKIFAAVVLEGTSGHPALTRSASVPPDGVRTIVIPLADDAYMTDEQVEEAASPTGGRGLRGWIPSATNRFDFRQTGSVNVFWDQRFDKHIAELSVLGIESGRTARVPKTIPVASFLPFVDKYGQFKHDDWPEKIHSDEDFATQRAEENAWLAAHPGSPTPDVDEFGGWEGGPQLEATGFFHTEKVNGKWWLVDPKGRLFFSLGITCLYAGTGTPVTDGRAAWFEQLPDSGPAVAVPYWSKKREMFFGIQNLIRKYGDNYEPPYAESTHRRFKAWGINTLGNWAHEYIWKLRLTPYCATIATKWRPLATDVDFPAFVADLRAKAEDLAAKMRDDPWCVGVFVDNELDWNGCGSEAGEVAEKYYSTVRAVLKEVLPNHLYLGSRIHFAPEAVWLASARHCDVVSHNFYEFEPSYDLPAGAPDKPIIIGEFHFGIKGRGHLVGGCVTVFDEKARAECFKHYVRACLDNPRYVGCHWFQYQNQPVSGRGDGENYNDGFVTVCDVPYPEMVEASREVAAELYTRRFSTR